MRSAESILFFPFPYECLQSLLNSYALIGFYVCSLFGRYKSTKHLMDSARTYWSANACQSSHADHVGISHWLSGLYNSSRNMNTASDFKQWLHAMKMVARLPGGTPPEFRRKVIGYCATEWTKRWGERESASEHSKMFAFLCLQLWLALADRHLHTTGIDWQKEESKCLSDDTWLDDDEELGIQIVKVRILSIHSIRIYNFTINSLIIIEFGRICIELDQACSPAPMEISIKQNWNVFCSDTHDGIQKLAIVK